jgi:hypothetical protein
MADLAHEELCELYHICFKGMSGEAVLNDLMNVFYNVTSLDDDANPNKVLVQEGKRFVVIYILSMIEEFELNEAEKMRQPEDNNGG